MSIIIQGDLMSYKTKSFLKLDLAVFTITITIVLLIIRSISLYTMNYLRNILLVINRKKLLLKTLIMKSTMEQLKM